MTEPSFMVIICAVCGGDRRLCHHETDEWYEALLTETRRHLLSYTEGYARLLSWHQKFRKERGEMKRRIKDLETQQVKLLARLKENATHDA